MYILIPDGFSVKQIHNITDPADHLCRIPSRNQSQFWLLPALSVALPEELFLLLLDVLFLELLSVPFVQHASPLLYPLELFVLFPACLESISVILLSLFLADISIPPYMVYLKYVRLPLALFTGKVRSHSPDQSDQQNNRPDNQKYRQ